MNRRDALVREINNFNKYLDPQLYIQANRSGEIMIVNYYYGKLSVARQSCYLDGPEIYLESGRTNINYRRRGFGTQIRAIILWCAKRAGYKTAFQTSMFLTNSNRSRNRPPSAYIMNKLGFNTYKNNKIMNSLNANNTTTEYRSMNLNRNTPGINAVIRQIMR